MQSQITCRCLRRACCAGLHWTNWSDLGGYIQKLLRTWLPWMKLQGLSFLGGFRRQTGNYAVAASIISIELQCFSFHLLYWLSLWYICCLLSLAVKEQYLRQVTESNTLTTEGPGASWRCSWFLFCGMFFFVYRWRWWWNLVCKIILIGKL